MERPIERRMLEENEIEPNGRAQSGAPRQPHLEHGGVSERRSHPAFAIISVGVDNSYGHPNRDVLERLAEHHADVYRTDRNGLVTVRTDGERLWVESFR